ncbi:MAG: DNA polymerase III subunit alpha [Bacteroidetes bacterium]|nr:DNA polymerase III subunit alpha [Bacteroidota bacterium]
MYLNGHSYYSYKYGVLSIEELLDLAVEQGYHQLALSDVNSSSGWVDFVRQADKRGIHPALGIDFRNGAQQLYVGIALNEEGRHELNHFLSQHLCSKTELPVQAPDFKHALIIYPFTQRRYAQLERENCYLGVSPYELNHFRLSPLVKVMDKVLMLHSASFRHKRDFNTHRLLRAMDNNMLLSMLPKKEEGQESDQMLSSEHLKQRFVDFPHILENTQAVLERCCQPAVTSFAQLNRGTHLNLQCYSGSKEEDERLIRALCEAGLPYRYPMANAEVHARVEKELSVIIQQGFVSYFLINWDIVNYARKKGYFYVGRGSGANSVVAYLLRITDVDPIELDLYFERFINLFRSSPPDFDMDFSWADREDITRYIFERFPTACLLGAYSTFQFRAARRELGKVFGLPAEEIEEIGEPSRYRHFQPRWEKEQSTSGAAGNSDHLKQLVLRYASYLMDKPSHLSIHACGILIPEKPISYYTATFMPPKGFPTAQISMLEAEDIGINKFDILSQRGLGKIKDSLELIKQNHPKDAPIDIHDIRRFKQDEKVKHLLRTGQAIGCFYVESPAMRMLMRKLEVDDYLGLVAASSVIRPGVAQSGMMQTYIQRKREPERRKDAHPVMLEIMPETFGVMVYQEDVIKVAHYFAGLSLAEADVLRRGMSGKYRSREEFLSVKEKFFSNCINEKGYSEELTTEIWRQTESFAGYAFAKGHSASYAVESYQSLFLKAYYPLEYMVATINNGGGFYTREHYIHEARMCGAIIEAPCIQESSVLTRIEGKVIYLGLHLIKGLDHDLAEALVDESSEGEYKDLNDLLDRVSMGMEQLSILIHVGALRRIQNSKFQVPDSAEKHPEHSGSLRLHSGQVAQGRPEILNTESSCASKKELLWQAYAIMEKHSKPRTEQTRLFQPPAKSYALPKLDHQKVEDAFDEMEYLGFPLCHPFDLLREEVQDDIRLCHLHAHVGERVTVYGYLVTAKNTKTVKGDRMSFGNFVDRDGAFLDTVHFPDVAARYPFRGKGVYAVTGKVTEEFNFQIIEVERMERLPYVDDIRYAEGQFKAPNSEFKVGEGPAIGDKESNRIRTENRKRNQKKDTALNPLSRGEMSLPILSKGLVHSSKGAEAIPLFRGGAEEKAQAGVCDNTNSDLSISSPSFHHSNTPLNPLSRGETPLPIVSDALVHNTKGYVVKD